MLIEKWVTFSYYFSGDVTVPLCMSALASLLLQKWNAIIAVKIRGENGELLSAPAAILKSIVGHMSSQHKNGDSPEPEEKAADEDEEWGKLRGMKDDDLKVCPDVVRYSEQMVPHDDHKIVGPHD